MTRVFNRMIIGLMTCALAGILTACSGNNQQDQTATASSVADDSMLVSGSSWYDDDTESTGSFLNDCDVEVTEIQTDEENTFTYDYDPDAEEINYYEGHSFIPEKSGTYNVGFYNIDPEGTVCYYATVWDDNMNRLLQVEYDSETSEEEIVDSIDLMAGETYYLTLSAFPEEFDAHVTGEVNYAVVQMDNTVEADQIIEDEVYEVSADGDEYLYVRFIPGEDGYYFLDIYVDDEDAECTAAVYSVLKNGEEDVDTGEGLLELEKDTEYYIVFGVENEEAKGIDVSLVCSKLDAVIMKGEGSEKVTDSGMVMFTPETSGKYLLYSVSDIDVSGCVYDADGDVIAENDDANGFRSKNDKDFAMYIDAEKGKQYLVVVDSTEESGSFECEFHIEASED